MYAAKDILWGIEVKAANGKPSALQLWNIEKIREAGGIAVVLYPNQFDEFKALMQSIKSRPLNAHSNQLRL